MEIPIYRTKMEQIRFLEVPFQNVETMKNAAEIIMPYIKDQDKEYLIALYLVPPNKMVGIEVLAIGSSNEATTSIREMIRGAIMIGATGVILAHNHPYGDVKPSKADILTTRQFQKASKIHGIELVGSLIVNEKGEFNDMMSVVNSRKETMTNELMDKINQESLIERVKFWFQALSRIVVAIAAFLILGNVIHTILNDLNGLKSLSPLGMAALLFVGYAGFETIKWSFSLKMKRFPKVSHMYVEGNEVVNKSLQEK
ncbi:JAB domain-containing protein [Brevibacillus sp. NPDC058079]|uniref:JAB domain-containing protein n=1 Tax=Brevibacillus sp. NPDC058079 TaxID=3346330 RepID=UPI0036E5EB65